jgi:UDP-N-acetyl-D-glucosamine dehydrogenase
MASTSTLETKLAQKIKKHRAKIGVIGLGYVGLPLAVEFAKNGFDVVGVDVNKAKVSALKKGVSESADISTKTVKRLLSSHRLSIASAHDGLASCDAVFICVPTPLNKSKDPDLSFVLRATLSARKQLKKGQLIVLESTISPGTTEEVILPELTKGNYRVGLDFFLAFSPERIDPGNVEFPLRKIPKVVGGMTNSCTRIASLLYGQIISDVVPVSSPRVAEMTKLLENTFRIVNIGLMNELLPVAHRLGVNLWEAIDAAKTKPFGYMPFYPGPGIGGHCIGIDPLYLSWKAKLVGAELRFVELASRVNAWMPNYVTRRIIYLLNQDQKPIRKSKILVLGVSYKKDIGDVRESPALEVIEELQQLGAQIQYHDPFVKRLDLDQGTLRSRTLTAAFLRQQDLVILLTAHSSVKYSVVVQHARRVLDTRNALQSIKKHRNKITLL